MRLVKATVISDASFCQTTKHAGWAVWVKVDGGIAIKESGRLKTCMTSTEAEVKAAGIGVWYAARAGASEILVQSDCMAVIHLIGGVVNSPPLLKVWAELWELPGMDGVTLTARHVKGHGEVVNARTYVNAWCDDAAYRAMEQARGYGRNTDRKSNRQGSGGRRTPQKGAYPSGGFRPRA